MKYLIKKIRFIWIIAIILTSFTCGCGNANRHDSQAAIENNENMTNLSIWWWGNQTRNERTRHVLNIYAQQNDITFQGEALEWKEYWSKLDTASATHNLPDIIQMDYKYLNQYVNHNLLVDLSQYIQTGELDLENVNDKIIQSGSVDGKVYAICTGVNAPALFYNKTLLDECGIQVKDYMSINNFIEISRQIYKKSGYKTNIGYGAEEEILEYILRDEGKLLYGDHRLAVNSPV